MERLRRLLGDLERRVAKRWIRFETGLSEEAVEDWIRGSEGLEAEEMQRAEDTLRKTAERYGQQTDK